MQFSGYDKMDSKQGIDAIFQFATEGILVTNEKSEIININPSAEKLFGFEKGELIGQKIEVLIPKRYTEKHVSHRDNFHQNPHARSMGEGMELYGAKKDGSEFPVEISLSPYSNEQGKFVVAFIIDISRRKLAEEKLKNYSVDLEKQVGNRTLILQEAITELEKTKNELNQALDKEKELNELKSRFVSMASHEFRTPLATIMSSLSLVKAYGEQNDSVKQSRHIQKIKSSIGNLTDILNDFLSVSKLEEGKVEHVQEQFEIQRYIKEVISEMELFCKAGQKISYNHIGGEMVLLDKKLIKHILYNLLSNAVKFSAENKKITISTERTETEFKISVEDQGIGISQKDQKHLFQRFFRAKNASNIQGTGLGLNIIENYIELMNGTISFTSVENEGTTFNLSFPQ
jgi:PAS domain S-box-containing protein